MILSGQLTAAQHKSHIPLQFDVPPGTTRLLARFHTSPKREPGAFFDNMVCLSLFGPNGPRGARHNNPVRDFAIEATRATPGYLPGKIEPGAWTVYMDCFRLLGTVDYTLEITCETGAVKAQSAYPAPQPLPRGKGWYRGDLHAHTLHSDGSWDVPDLVAWARRRGLDFLTLTDHNTASGQPQAHALAGDDLLTMGGLELTTHWGHALSLGGDDWHEWRVGSVTGRTMPMLADDVMGSGALFVIAHPMSPGDPSCTGCRWEYGDMMPGNAPLIEVWNGGPWSDYNEEGLTLFQHWLALGHRLRATAGSDIHGAEGGVGQIGFNHVEADALTEPAILRAVSQGRNYLSSGPRLILTAKTPMGEVAGMGDTVPAGSTFHADWQSDHLPLTVSLVDATGLRSAQAVPAEASGVAELAGAMRFVMAELRDATGRLHAVTNPIFVG